MADRKRAVRKVAQRQNERVRANSVTRALNVIGDRWTLLILYRAFLGSRRFDEFQRSTGTARSLLTGRLKRLVSGGLMRRELYQSRPRRFEYRLTEMGADLYTAAMMIVRWEKRWHYDRRTPTHRLRHTGCGAVFTPELRCAHCRRLVAVHDIALRARPGNGADRRPAPRVQRRSTVTSEQSRGLEPMLERAIEVLGDRWTSHVIAAAFYGERRFGSFQTALQIASNLLSDRLARVVRLGVIDKVAVEGPVRHEYRLTDCGRDLFPIIVALMGWGDRWLAKRQGPPEVLIHKPCGKRLKPLMTCDQCNAPFGFGDVDVPKRGRRTKLANTD